MALIFYLAWVGEGVAFNAGAHATTATKIWDGVEGGEIVFSLELDHSEGEFPSLRAELINPRVGLLSAGREQWVWLSQDDGSGVEPLFHGRVIGVPEQLSDEILMVEFVARPPDFVAQKEAVLDALRVLPYFDPAFLQQQLEDADTVLEARTARVHIDPVTLAVTVSDIIAGEDGTLEIGEADHLYEDMQFSYGDPPLRRVSIKASVEWTQTGAGDVDLTRQLCAAFADGGSPYPAPYVSTMTGEGFLGAWPEPLTDIGGGWSLAASSAIEPATWLQPKAYVVEYGDRADGLFTGFQFPEIAPLQLMLGGDALFGRSPDFENNETPLPPPSETVEATEDPFGNWQAAFPLGVYKVAFVFHYQAARDRAETVTATLEADVQPLLVDPGADEQGAVEISSDVVGQPIDAGGVLPIGDLRRNSYFKTDRGRQSWEYALLLGRALLIRRSRAVNLAVATPWSVAAGITCRKNAHIVDNRLPGGEATGKVVGARRRVDGDAGEARAEIRIGCAIGYGAALPAAAAGEPVYVEDGVLEDGIQARTGAEVAVIAGELQYQSFDEFEIDDDDGVDLLNMTPATVLEGLVVTGGVFAQQGAINEALRLVNPDPVAGLEAVPTTVTVDLKPVEGGRFRVDFAPEVSALVVPQTIDLEAA